MVAARTEHGGSGRQIAGYQSDDPNDTSAILVSWAIFEIVWGTAVNRQTEEYEDLTRARMSMHRVCVYHAGQDHISGAARICGEIIATVCLECVQYQVDIMAGDGNKAAYYPTPKSPGCPSYEVSLLQFWIDRMISSATQARLRHHQGPAPPVRAKHFISCSFEKTWIWYNSNTTSKASRLRRAHLKLQQKLTIMVIAVC